MSAPHVLYVQERFPVPSETFVRAEVAELRRLGVPASVATSRHPVRSWGPVDDLARPGRLLGGSVAGVMAGHGHWWRRPRRYARYLHVLATAPLRDKPFVLLAPAIARAAEAGGVTHVHTHFAFRAASVARAVAALLGCHRSVTTHANDLFVRNRDLAPRLQDARVLTISEHNREFLAQRGLASVVNHCGVDVDRLTALGGDPAGAAAADVLFVGRLVPKKGPLQLLEAVRLLRDEGTPLVVRVVGDGPLRAEAEAYAARHGLPVRFDGALPPEEVLAAMASATVLGLPCRRAADGDLDGIPVVLMEAMALGTAVVTTAVSGIPELVGDAGWLVPASDDPAGLAAALAEALARDDLRAERTARARERVRAGFTLRGQALGVLAAAGAPADPHLARSAA